MARASIHKAPTSATGDGGAHSHTIEREPMESGVPDLRQYLVTTGIGGRHQHWFLLPSGELVQTTLGGAHIHTAISSDWCEQLTGGVHQHSVRVGGIDFTVNGDGWHEHCSQAEGTSVDGVHDHWVTVGDQCLWSLTPQQIALVTGLSGGKIRDVLMDLRMAAQPAAVVRHGSATEIRTPQLTVSIDGENRARIAQGWQAGGRPEAVGTLEPGWVDESVVEFWVVTGARDNPDVERYELHKTEDGWVRRDDQNDRPLILRSQMLPLPPGVSALPSVVTKAAGEECRFWEKEGAEAQEARQRLAAAVVEQYRDHAPTTWTTRAEVAGTRELFERVAGAAADHPEHAPASDLLALLDQPIAVWGADEIQRCSRYLTTALADEQVVRAAWPTVSDVDLGTGSDRTVVTTVAVAATSEPDVEKAELTEDEIRGWLVDHFKNGKRLSVSRIKRLLDVRDQYPYLQPPDGVTKIYRGLHDVSKADVERMTDGTHPYTSNTDKSWTTNREIAERYSRAEFTADGPKPGRFAVVLEADLPRERALLNASAIAKLDVVKGEWSELWGEHMEVSVEVEAEVIVYGQVEVTDVSVEENPTPERHEFRSFMKAEDLQEEERFVYGVVMEPLEVDTEGDTQTAETIRAAAHGYMEHHRNIGLQHKLYVNDAARILESYISPVDFTAPNGELVKAGSWVMGVRILDDEIWAACKSGKLSGFSIGGRGVRAPIALD